MPFNEFKFLELRQRVKELEVQVAPLAETIEKNANDALKEAFQTFKEENDTAINGIKQNVVNNTNAIKTMEETFNKALIEKIDLLTSSLKQISAKVDHVYDYVFGMPEDASHWMINNYPEFAELTAVPEKDNILDWSKVISLESAFDGCEKLESINENIITPSCKNYHWAFAGCKMLKELTVDCTSITEENQLYGLVHESNEKLIIRLINVAEDLAKALSTSEALWNLGVVPDMVVFINSEKVEYDMAAVDEATIDDEGFWDVDENGDLMPPKTDERNLNWELDTNGDIQSKPVYIDKEESILATNTGQTIATNDKEKILVVKPEQ